MSTYFRTDVCLICFYKIFGLRFKKTLLDSIRRSSISILWGLRIYDISVSLYKPTQSTAPAQHSTGTNSTPPKIPPSHLISSHLISSHTAPQSSLCTLTISFHISTFTFTVLFIAFKQWNTWLHVRVRIWIWIWTLQCYDITILRYYDVALSIILARIDVLAIIEIARTLLDFVGLIWDSQWMHIWKYIKYIYIQLIICIIR